MIRTFPSLIRYLQELKNLKEPSDYIGVVNSVITHIPLTFLYSKPHV